MSCRATGCGQRTTGWSRYCPAHKSRLRRHGHPEQQGVSKAALQPYLKRLQAVRDRNAGNPLWLLLDQRWEGLVEGCMARERSYVGGLAANRNEIRAAKEILRLSSEARPADVIDVVAAMILMSRREPSRFRSDAAVFHQTARRVRNLSETSSGSRCDPRTGKIRRVYRDLSPKTALILGRWFVEAFGGLGVWVYGLEQEAARETEKLTAAINQAMRELR